MVLARKFTQAEDNDYERLVAAHGRLRAILDAFAEGSLPPEYDSSRLAAYAASLIAVQNDDGSFSSSKTPETLTGDERDDALRFVTWVAAALLCRLKTELPAEASSLEGLDEAVARALNRPETADFRFPESGPAEAVQQVEAALILAAGNVPALLKSRPALAPSLTEGLDRLTAAFQSRLETGDTTLPGGIDYRPLFEQALAGLSG